MATERTAECSHHTKRPLWGRGVLPGDSNVCTHTLLRRVGWKDSPAEAPASLPFGTRTWRLWREAGTGSRGCADTHNDSRPGSAPRSVPLGEPEAMPPACPSVLLAGGGAAQEHGQAPPREPNGEFQNTGRGALLTLHTVSLQPRASPGCSCREGPAEGRAQGTGHGAPGCGFTERQARPGRARPGRGTPRAQAVPV